MAKAGGKGILLWDYIKSCDEPEHVVRMKLDRRELCYTWFDIDGSQRFSDDGGPRWPEGWWLRAKIDREEHSAKPGNDPSLRWVSGPDYGPDVLVGQMYRVKVFPAVTAADAPNPKGRPATKYDLVLDILAEIKIEPGLQPAAVRKKVLPVFRPRWKKLEPDDDTEPTVSPRVITRAYRDYLNK